MNSIKKLFSILGIITIFVFVGTMTSESLSAQSGSASSYQFSSGFSGSQGQNDWGYFYSPVNSSTLNLMSYNSSSKTWNGNETNLIISGNGIFHPGWASDAVLVWTAPTTGDITISGTISDGDSGGGDGVVLIIKKNSSELFRKTISNGQTGVGVSVSASVSSGDKILFAINKNSGSTYDTTIFDPTVSYSQTFTSSSDTTSPTISNISSSNITQSTATISWTTNEASDSQVEYGLTTAYGSQSSLNSSLTTSHSDSLSGLTENTVYHYRVNSKDSSNNLAQSGGDLTFTTLAVSTPTNSTPTNTYTPTSFSSGSVNSNTSFNAVTTVPTQSAATTGGDNIAVDTLIDFEGGSDGSTLTNSIASASTKGKTFDGIATVSDPAGFGAGSTPNLKVTSSASAPYSFSANVNGTSYSVGGSKGMRATMSPGGENGLMISLPTNTYSTFYLGYYFRFNGAGYNDSPRDVVGITAPNGTFQFMQIYDSKNGTPYVHSHWQPPYTMVGPNVSITRGKWYWATMKAVQAGGSTQLKIYDPSNNYSLVGSSAGSVATPTSPFYKIVLGAIKYNATSDQSIDYDDFVISMSGSEPIPTGSSGTPPPPTTTYTITASAGTGGSISPSGSLSINSGNSQSFSITPNSGYQVSSVMVDGSAVSISSSGGTYTISNITSNRTIIASFSQTSAPDTTSPSTPSGLNTSNVQSNSVSLSWNASTDSGTGVGGYYIYRGSAQIGTSQSTTYTDSGVSPSTSYSYSVAAYDKASPANISSQSASVSVTTPAAPTTSGIESYLANPTGSSLVTAGGSRLTNWGSQVGVGGIPDRPDCSVTISAGASQSTIQNALNNSSCQNKAVKLPAGTYNITGSLVIPSNVTLRGSGPQQTILQAKGSGNGVIMFGSGISVAAGGTNINSGTSAGSTNISVSSASGISVGSHIMITQVNGTGFLSKTNPTPYVSSNTNNGACTWCDQWSGTRTQGQIVEVTSVSGNSLGITPPLFVTYNASPLATIVPAGVKYAGAEDLQVYSNNTGYIANFYMSGADYSWIKNVESNYTEGDHVEVHYGYRDEIRDSYFHDGFAHAAGNNEITIFVADKTTSTLVENNLLRRLMSSIMFNWGAAGNVAAYNYSEGAFNTTGYNTLFGKITTHGAHPMFNLLEGNVTSNFDSDFFWGSASHNTAFRNWFTGAGTICQPLSGRGTETGCYAASQALFGVDLSQTVRFDNIIGNIIGIKNSMTAANWTPQVVYPSTNRSYYTSNNPYGMSFGYATLPDGGSDSNDTNLSYTTAILHGNYDNVKNSFMSWVSGVSNQLPSSLYLSGKPSFFGSLAWPAFGPDPSNPNSALVGTIPAKYCWENGQKMPNCLTSVTNPPPTTTYTITASAGTGGSISPSGSLSVNSGNSQSFSITPNSGYQVSSVMVDGSAVGAVSTYTLSNITSNHTIIVSFSQTPVSVTPPSAPAGLSASVISSTQINLSWNASVKGTNNIAGYNIYRTDFGAVPLATVTSTSFNNTGLTENTTYSYLIEAVDTAGNKSSQSAIQANTPKAIPVSNKFTIGQRVEVFNTGGTGLRIYGGFSDATSIGLQQDGAMGKVIGGSYNYVGTSGSYQRWNIQFDVAPGNTTTGAWAAEDWLQVSTVDQTLPLISTFTIPSAVNSLTVSITSLIATDNIAVTGYFITESSVAPSVSASGWSTTVPTLYTFTSAGSKTLYVFAKDAAGNVSIGKSATVVVTLPDTQAPTVSLTSPANNTVVTIGSAVTVSANASDNIGIVGVQFKLDGTNISTEDISAPYSIAWDTSNATIGSHTLTALARDATGNQTTSSPVSITIQPTISTRFSLNDQVSVTGGTITVRSSAAGSSLGTHSTNDFGTIISSTPVYAVLSGTGYWWWNVKFDTTPGNGTTGGWIAEDYLVKVLPDTTSPSTPAGLSASVISSTQVNLSWNASIDPTGSGQVTSGVAGYKIYRGGVQINTTSNTTYSDTNLSPATPYTYSVSSYDVAGNTSSQSSNASVTTDPTPSTTFKAGDRVQVNTGDGSKLNIRSSPNGTVIGQQDDQALGTIVSGPTLASSLQWWNVNFDSGTDGWAAEQYLKTYIAPSLYTITASAGLGGTISPSSASVVSGGSQTFVVTPNSSYQVSSVSLDGNAVMPLPVAYTGGSYSLSNINSNHTISIAFTSASTKFSTGDRVVTNNVTDVRSSPSSLNRNNVLSTLQAGLIGTVSVGSGYANPYYSEGGWWRYVSYDSGDAGWSTEDRLDKYSNNPPVLPTIGNKTVNENVALSFVVSPATDIDGDLITYSASGLPVGATFNSSTRTFNWTPSYTQAGIYNGVIFTATDSHGATGSQTITITVTNINRAPTANAGNDQTVTLPASAVLSGLGSSDPDGNTLTYLWSQISGPSVAIFSSKTASNTTVSFNSTSGLYVFQLSVSDGSFSNTDTVSITVNPAIVTITDTDGDSVPDTSDKCANTPATLRGSVNNVGCPKPKVTKFTTSDLGNVDLNNVSSLDISNSYGKVSYTTANGPYNLVGNNGSAQLDIDSSLTITFGEISLDSANIPQLNKPATLYFYNISIPTEDLRVLRDDNICDLCHIVSYQNNTLVITVPGFSTFKIVSAPPPPSTPPVITAVATTSITDSGATISWYTDVPSDSLVNYGLTDLYGNESRSSDLVTSHSIILENLTSSTLYHFMISSTNDTGVSATTTDLVFQTDTTPVALPPPTTPPPPTGGGGGGGGYTPPPTSGGGGGGGGPINSPPPTNGHPKLPQAQIDSILNLLKAFGADQTVIDKVLAALIGNFQATSETSNQSVSNTTSSNRLPSTFSFTSSVNVYTSSPDIKYLQIFLNDSGYIVSLSGPGSKGNETNYFGSATIKALSAFQKANGISPAYGNFGPITIEKINQLLKE